MGGVERVDDDEIRVGFGYPVIEGFDTFFGVDCDLFLRGVDGDWDEPVLWVVVDWPFLSLP